MLWFSCLNGVPHQRFGPPSREATLPFLDLPLLFLDQPLPFLDLPLLFLDLSLPFRAQENTWGDARSIYQKQTAGAAPTTAKVESSERCVVRDSNSGHQLLLPPANWCPMFASRTAQDQTLLLLDQGRSF